VRGGLRGSGLVPAPEAVYVGMPPLRCAGVQMKYERCAARAGGASENAIRRLAAEFEAEQLKLADEQILCPPNGYPLGAHQRAPAKRIPVSGARGRCLAFNRKDDSKSR
jgi:hypothetical protein